MHGARVSTSAAFGMVALLTASVLGVGCSGDDGSSGTESTSAESTSTEAASTTLSPPVASEPDCSTGALERDLGSLGYSACDGEWAAVMPTSYTDVCTDCESTWLARWDGTAWRLAAQCYAYAILTEEENGCSEVAGSFPDPSPTGRDITAVPPPDVACAIWGYNTLEESLAVTGCEPG